MPPEIGKHFTFILWEVKNFLSYRHTHTYIYIYINIYIYIYIERERERERENISSVLQLYSKVKSKTAIHRSRCHRAVHSPCEHKILS